MTSRPETTDSAPGHLPLWPHQAAALEMIQGFLAARRARSGTSALVRMPTGTGKSGVIAVAAHSLVETGDVLLLSPWDALVTQLAADVRSAFWKKMGSGPPSGKPVRRLYPSTAGRLLEAGGPGTIWTATIATLQQLHASYPRDYEALAGRLRLVVVDEGHYEPAPTWATAVRGLARPTVLFTATPYRNDLKYFDVDRHRHNYQYSHAEAETDRYLRRVRFETQGFDSPESFCDELLAAVDARLGDRPDSKVIVRCESRNSVQRVARELQARERAVVAIHERFQHAGPNAALRRQVPRPEAEPAQFWVHQHKLTEGIDAAQFRMVAFYEPFSGERAFVQQVGRVLRNPRRDPADVAWVLGAPHAHLKESWDAYRAYDTATRDTGLPVSPREFARKQPLAQYFDRRFRTAFDLDDPDIHREFLYPLSVRVYDAPGPLDLDALAQSVAAALEESDCETGTVAAPAPDVRVHPYVAVRNSPLLARAAFTEFEVGFTVYRRLGRYLFYYDTQGVTPEAIGSLTPVDPGRLRHLYSGEAARLTSVSTINTDLGPYSPRRRSVHARSVDELGPDLSDHAHLAASSAGRTAYRLPDGRVDPRRERQTRTRYVGFTRSRIRDGGTLEFDDYLDWLDSLASSLDDSSARALPVFDRYAEVIDPPDQPTPANILLDIPGQLFETIRDGDREWLDVEDLCLDVHDGSFPCVANGVSYQVNLGYLQPYVGDEPRNAERWSRGWDGGVVGRVDRRIRRGVATTGQRAWQQFLGALRDPRTTREVWLVLGQGPRRSLLIEECKKPRPGAELIQMLYSLQSTWTAVASLGARLRVFSAR